MSFVEYPTKHMSSIQSHSQTPTEADDSLPALHAFFIHAQGMLNIYNLCSDFFSKLPQWLSFYTILAQTSLDFHTSCLTSETNQAWSSLSSWLMFFSPALLSLLHTRYLLQGRILHAKHLKSLECYGIGSQTKSVLLQQKLQSSQNYMFSNDYVFAQLDSSLRLQRIAEYSTIHS